MLRRAQSLKDNQHQAAPYHYTENVHQEEPETCDISWEKEGTKSMGGDSPKQNTFFKLEVRTLHRIYTVHYLYYTLTLYFTVQNMNLRYLKEERHSNTAVKMYNPIT